MKGIGDDFVEIVMKKIQNNWIEQKQEIAPKRFVTLRRLYVCSASIKITFVRSN